MRPCGHLLACAVGFIALVLGGSSLAGAAAFKPITGRLDKSGYTVIALAANGEAGSVIAQGGSFSVVPPAATVTLQLRGPDGSYAGPIVLAEQGDKVKQARAAVTRAERKVKQAKRKVAKRLKHARQQLTKARKQLTKAKRLLAEAKKQAAARPNTAILGVKAGAPLGAVTVNSAAGYALARLNERVWKTWVDTTRWARAKNGAPIGAGNFGRVRSKYSPGTVPGDSCLSGVPDVLNIANHCNMILNSFYSSTAAHASQAQNDFTFHSYLNLTLNETANVDAGSSDQQIETSFQTAPGSLLMMNILPGDSAALDCGALEYCSEGGTGRVFDPRVLPQLFKPFPACCDPSGDGFGTLSPVGGPPGPGGPAFFLHPGTTTAQMHTGDVLVERVTTGETVTQYPATLQFVFATAPALQSFSVGQGSPVTILVSGRRAESRDGDGWGSRNKDEPFPG